MNIEYKSTGQLIDELFTTALKVENGIEGAYERYEALKIAIVNRIGNISFMASRTCQELEAVLKSCWNAQEIVMEYDIEEQDTHYAIASAAKEAQRLNAERTRLIRAIDGSLGETDRTTLEKSYG